MGWAVTERVQQAHGHQFGQKDAQNATHLQTSFCSPQRVSAKTESLPFPEGAAWLRSRVGYLVPKLGNLRNVTK